MSRLATIALGIAASFWTPASAQEPVDHAAIAASALEAHIAPRHAAFAEAASALIAPAEACDADGLRGVFPAAALSWTALTHLGLGPIEDGDARLSLAFWPDARGAVRRGLERLIAAEDPIVDDPERFADASVAVRGLTALERLVFSSDAGGAPPALTGYRCRLAAAITRDVARTAAELGDAWSVAGPDMLRAGAGSERFLTAAEPTRGLFTSLDAGLQALVDQRLGRPIGEVGRPRPGRAEYVRSGLSRAAATASLDALRELYEAAFRPELSSDDASALDAAFARAADALQRIGAPIDRAVTSTQSRLRVEVAQTRLRELRGLAADRLGRRLGVQVGFNSLDGD